ncbi:MAG TPA: hypothetical protein VG477_15170, partial [Thermoanaerobaculia bacterium]|nr:hypothetical protein [Thermoanaerobaculia bacterium]
MGEALGAAHRHVVGLHDGGSGHRRRQSGVGFIPQGFQPRRGHLADQDVPEAVHRPARHAVARAEGPADAPIAQVFAARGRLLGLGFHSPLSQIRVRMLGAEVEAADRSFFADRLAEAVGLREA